MLVQGASEFHFFFEIFKRFFLNVAFDLVHMLAGVTKGLLENFLHLQFIDKCVLQNSSPTPKKIHSTMEEEFKHSTQVLPAGCI